MISDLIPQPGPEDGYLVRGPEGTSPYYLGYLNRLADDGGDVWVAYYPANGGEEVGRFRLATLAVQWLLEVHRAESTLCAARVNARLGRVLG